MICAAAKEEKLLGALSVLDSSLLSCKINVQLAHAKTGDTEWNLELADAHADLTVEWAQI